MTDRALLRATLGKQDTSVASRYAENEGIESGEAVILSPHSEGMALGRHKVRYDELAQFIQQLYEIAVSLEDHRDTWFGPRLRWRSCHKR